jgi:hypothetical protein
VTTDIEVTGDRLVDLGVLPWNEGDSGLRLKLEGNKPPTYLQIEISLFPQPSRLDGLPLAAGQFEYSSFDTQIYDVPSGTYLLKSRSPYNPWVVEPSEIYVELPSGYLADVSLNLIPITMLHISSAKKMVSVNMTDQSGQVYHFERRQNLQSPPHTCDAQTVVLESRDFHALAANLPEGRYRVEIVLEQDRKHFETLLERGQEKRLDYRGN